MHMHTFTRSIILAIVILCVPLLMARVMVMADPKVSWSSRHATPTGRAFVPGIELSDGRLFFAGGDLGKEVATSPEAWIYDSKASFFESKWSQKSSMPIALSSFALAYDSKDTLFVYGGAKFVDDDPRGSLYLYSLSNNSWTSSPISGPNRTDSVAWIHNDTLFIHGGYNMDHSSSGEVCSLAIADMLEEGEIDGNGNVVKTNTKKVNTNAKWTCITPENSPVVARHRIAIIGPDQLFMYGGDQNEGVIGETMLMDMNTLDFKSLGYKYDAPQNRSNHMLAYSSKCNCVWLYSGVNSYDEFFKDLWEYDLAAETWNMITPQGKEADWPVGYMGAPHASTSSGGLVFAVGCEDEGFCAYPRTVWELSVECG